MLAAGTTVLLFSVAATALLSSVQRLEGAASLDARGGMARAAAHRPAHRLATARVKPSAGVIATHAPRVLQTPAPRYPIEALRAGRGGKVLVRARLGGNGQVIATAVAASSGDPSLDRAAQAAVRHWVFRMDSGSRRTLVIPIRFRIDRPRTTNQARGRSGS